MKLSDFYFDLPEELIAHGVPEEGQIKPVLSAAGIGGYVYSRFIQPTE